MTRTLEQQRIDRQYRAEWWIIHSKASSVLMHVQVSREPCHCEFLFTTYVPLFVRYRLCCGTTTSQNHPPELAIVAALEV